MSGYICRGDETLYKACTPPVEYIADETQGGASSYSYLARYIGLLLIAPGLCAGKEILDFSQKICAVYIIAAILFTINGLLLVMLDVYNARDKQKNRPMKGFVQVLRGIAVLYRRHCYNRGAGE